MYLGFEYFDKLAADITNWTMGQVCTTLQTTNLMTTWCDDAINGILIADNTL